MELQLNSFQQNFEHYLLQYEEQCSGGNRKPWTQKRIDEIISIIKNARVAMNSGGKRTSMEYYWLSKYDIMTVCNEEHLIFKRKSIAESTVRIVAREQYTVLSEIHNSNGHGGRDKIIYDIKNELYIPKKAIEIFVSLCSNCGTKRNNTKKCMVTCPIALQDFNVRGQVDLIDFQYCADGEYKWLLNYQNNATKFACLRPLKTKRVTEVAIELLKIFLTFGPPHILQSENGREFTAKVIEELKAMWPDYKILLGSPRRPQTQGSVEQSNQGVENMLRSWMTDNKSSNWSLGCFFVQYQNNVSFHHMLGSSPFKALFGNDPKAGIIGSKVSPSVLLTIETEEELKILLEQQLSDDIPTQTFNKNNTMPLISNSDNNVVMAAPLLKRTAEKMLDNTAKKLLPLALGDSVFISVPKVDRGPLDTKNIKGQIVDFKNGLYKVGTKTGTIKNWFARNELAISLEGYIENILAIPISLREAVTNQSITKC